MEYYRNYFGYAKIYECLRDVIEDIFGIKIEYRHISLLIKLINNRSLIFKKLSSVIIKIKVYLKENIVEKNVINCCILLQAMVENYPELFQDELIMSLLAYLNFVK